MPLSLAGPSGGDEMVWIDGSRLAYVPEGTFTMGTGAGDAPEHAVTLVVGPVEVHLPLEGMVDAGAERARLSRELADSEAQIRRVDQLLASDFGSKAPEAVVKKERDRLAALKETAEKLRAQLK